MKTAALGDSTGSCTEDSTVVGYCEDRCAKILGGGPVHRKDLEFSCFFTFSMYFILQ